MTTASVLITGINMVLITLTPLKRWQSARRLDSSFWVERWFIMMGLAVVIILTVLFVLISLNRMLKERRISRERFSEYAARLGLTKREREILKEVSIKAKLKQNESIFTTPVAFNRGAAKVVEDTLARQGSNASLHLRAALSILGEKLGFEIRRPVSISSVREPNKPNSRQIPVGQKLQITRFQNHELVDTECTVIKNDDGGLVIRLMAPFDSRPGEHYCVRHYSGASIWEFDACVLRCRDGIIVLNHSDNVRFVNRRRFVRVPTDAPAYIAHFPFVRTLATDNHSSEQTKNKSAKVAEDKWGPPTFVPAIVTELAGPGLRVEAPLEVKVNDRVAVILKMCEEQPQSFMIHRSQVFPRPDGTRDDRTKPIKIVENIGEVRHKEITKNGFSIAIELTGLSESNMKELVRATNAASIKNLCQNSEHSGFREQQHELKSRSLIENI